jgi:hypothetical protein
VDQAVITGEGTRHPSSRNPDPSVQPPCHQARALGLRQDARPRRGQRVGPIFDAIQRARPAPRRASTRALRSARLLVLLTADDDLQAAEGSITLAVVESRTNSTSTEADGRELGRATSAGRLAALYVKAMLAERVPLVIDTATCSSTVTTTTMTPVTGMKSQLRVWCPSRPTWSRPSRPRLASRQAA